MELQYTDERHILILIDLMKRHGVRRVIVSPGTTNLTFVGSIQRDPFFKLYSSVDERSAAYMACGMAEESGEPVALSCTGATASRNYVSGLTEAYYRKLPVLALTSTQHRGRIGQNMPQVIDRTVLMKDVAKLSIQVFPIYTEEDAWSNVVSINEALLELKHNGGGPVHINLSTTYSRNFDVKTLPINRMIERVCYKDELIDINVSKIGIFVGAHLKWGVDLVEVVDAFCEKYSAVVFCDQTSNYPGNHAIYPSLVCSQTEYDSSLRSLELLIHIGDISGSDIDMHPNEIWRVNPDGKVRDTFRKLTYVFEMEEIDFFNLYVKKVDNIKRESNYYSEWKKECERIESKIPDLPFSNVWLAQQTVKRIPEGNTLYVGILNSLRSWNYFAAPKNVDVYSNTGGFGIDGGVSSLIGASLVNPDKLYFCVTGDLSFFYDMNVVGNRHIHSNVRIMIVNNGRGTEFTNYNHPGAQFGEDAKPFIAAAGHFGNKSEKLIKHYAEDLGFEYFSAKSKKEYSQISDEFVSSEMNNKPQIFEIFTDGNDESDAIEIMRSLKKSALKSTKKIIKGVLGDKNVAKIKKIIKH